MTMRIFLSEDGRTGGLAGRRSRSALQAAGRLKALFTLFLAASLAGAGASALPVDGIRVVANVESRDVYVGESFLMQISVDGSDEAEIPDVGSIEGFTAEYMGGSNNSSQSISIINGRVERNVQKGFVFTYKLTPQRSGRLTIPSMDVRVEDTTFRTSPITISVKRPQETEDFKLRIRMSRETCFVGEPVLLTVIWYLKRDVQDFEFTAPLLSNDAFSFESPEVKIDPEKQYFRIALGGREVIAEKGRGILDGESYATLSFSMAVIPERPGTFVIPEFIVACESGTGMRSRRDFLDDFFGDDVFGRWRGSLKKYVVPSNSLSLVVKDLPSEGRPEGFAGHVGEYRVSAQAEPTEVNIGDPITLKIILEGPDYLGRVELPSLAGQKELAENFKIPDEMAAGRIEGKRKIFTQTIRAKHEGIQRIPPISLVYFDTAREKYETASSKPIPITVRATRIVTASDAEGIDSGDRGTPLERWKAGIAYNYEGREVIEPQDFGLGSILSSTGVKVALVLPPLAWLLVLGASAISRRRSADPDAVKARGALRRLRARLSELPDEKNDEIFCSGVMEALKEFIGDKLKLAGRSLTTGEMAGFLIERGVDGDLVSEVSALLSSCEYGAYSGGSNLEDRKNLLERAGETARKLERAL
jgi:hypothetical protein